MKEGAVMKLLLRVTIIFPMAIAMLMVHAILVPAASAAVATSGGECKECRWNGGSWACTYVSVGWGFSECEDNGGMLCEYSGGCIAADALPVMLDGSVEHSLAQHLAEPLAAPARVDAIPYVRDCRGVIRGRQYSPQVVVSLRSATATLTL